ncbi:MAG TPA: hypothetical protein VNR40_06850 [Steroidobacter sp.]|nr:hypothetical protein [Steroidobacter sp.]
MSKVVLISVASSLGLGLLSLHLVKQLKEGEATIADLKAQVASLQEQQRQPLPVMPSQVVEQQPAEPPRQVVATAAKEAPKGLTVVTAPNALAAPPNRDDRLRMMREHRERQRQLMQDPEYREAMRVQTRGNFARQYPGVIAELGLDAQQADEFFDLLADQQLRTTEQMQPLWEMEGMDSSDPATRQERHRKISEQAQENQRRSEAEMTARFGQDKLQAWKEYQSSMGMRYELENMRNTLSANGLPLSDDLSKPMLKALAQAQQAEANEYSAAMNRGEAHPMALLASNAARDGGNNMERQIDAMRKRNQRMLDAIAPYLSYQQRAAVEKQQDAQLKMQEAQLRLMRAQGKADNIGVFFGETAGVTVLQ